MIIYEQHENIEIRPNPQNKYEIAGQIFILLNHIVWGLHAGIIFYIYFLWFSWILLSGDEPSDAPWRRLATAGDGRRRAILEAKADTPGPEHPDHEPGHPGDGWLRAITFARIAKNKLGFCFGLGTLTTSNPFRAQREKQFGCFLLGLGTLTTSQDTLTTADDSWRRAILENKTYTCLGHDWRQLAIADDSRFSSNPKKTRLTHVPATADDRRR